MSIAAIGVGIALASVLITLLVMFSKVVDQNATMRTTLEFVRQTLTNMKSDNDKRFESLEGKMDAIRDQERRR